MPTSNVRQNPLVTRLLDYGHHRQNGRAMKEEYFSVDRKQLCGLFIIKINIESWKMFTHFILPQIQNVVFQSFFLVFHIIYYYKVVKSYICIGKKNKKKYLQ